VRAPPPPPPRARRRHARPCARPPPLTRPPARKPRLPQISLFGQNSAFAQATAKVRRICGPEHSAGVAVCAHLSVLAVFSRISLDICAVSLILDVGRPESRNMDVYQIITVNHHQPSSVICPLASNYLKKNSHTSTLRLPPDRGASLAPPAPSPAARRSPTPATPALTRPRPRWPRPRPSERSAPAPAGHRALVARRRRRGRFSRRRLRAAPPTRVPGGRRAPRGAARGAAGCSRRPLSQPALSIPSPLSPTRRAAGPMPRALARTPSPRRSLVSGAAPPRSSRSPVAFLGACLPENS
jgi:hypothetical protein